MEEHNPDIFTLTDDEGQEHEFEFMDMMKLDGVLYYALVPYTDDPHAKIEEDTELVVLKVGEENGTEFLSMVDNDEEYNRVGNIFMDRISEMLESGEDTDEE